VHESDEGSVGSRRAPTPAPCACWRASGVPRTGSAGRSSPRSAQGLVDTEASRPWFESMNGAQTPAEAAVAPLRLALDRAADASFYGELVQFGRVISWR
jgi:hypothetical protein